MKSVLIGLSLLVLGILVGWIARDVYRPEKPTSRPPMLTTQSIREENQVDHRALIDARRFDELAHRPSLDFARYATLVSDLSIVDKRFAVSVWHEARGESFDSVLTEAQLAIAEGSFSEAVDLILAAALYAENGSQRSRLEQTLSVATEQYSKQLIAANRLDSLDALYERITLSLPELSEYYLLLGQLRIRMGSFDEALAPLAQIQNHSSLGSKARSLIVQAESSEAFEAASLEELPLRVAGSQYIVDAVVDQGAPVSLMIDTGAAMTVLDQDVLARLGYSLSGERQYFSTAGGVVEAPVITLDRLMLGGTGVNQLPVGALALDMPQGIDGLLGMNFLRHFEFRIDQEAVVLHLHTAR